MVPDFVDMEDGELVMVKKKERRGEESEKKWTLKKPLSESDLKKIKQRIIFYRALCSAFRCYF